MVLTMGTVLFGGLALVAGGLFGASAGKIIANNIENIGQKIESKNALTNEIARALEAEKSREQRRADIGKRKAEEKPITPNDQPINTTPSITDTLWGQSTTEEKEETPSQQPINPIPSINDKTEENTENQINGIASNFEYAMKWAEEQQKKQWEREDAIRKETQEREDTAYSRAIQDLRNAGVNPNLFNVSPAESGGGITQATGLNMTLYQEEMKKYISEFETLMNNEVKTDENTKDRLLEVVSKFITIAGMVGMLKK